MSINPNIPPKNPYVIPYPPVTNFQISTKARDSVVQQPVYFTGDNILPKTSVFYPRSNVPNKRPSPLNAVGIPGSNFVAGDVLNGTFFQGEDIVFDAFLYNNHQTIDLERYTIKGIVKPTQYLKTNYWTGDLGNGIFADPTLTDHFVIFIPGVTPITCTVDGQPKEILKQTFEVAGNMQLDIWLIEKINQDQTIKPRTILVGFCLFNIEYAAFSPHADTTEVPPGTNRATLVHSYPPAWNTTIGGNPGGPASGAYDGIG